MLWIWMLLTACEPTGAVFGVAVDLYEPGDNAGFGQNELLDVVLGPPQGGGANAGSLDVLSLGNEGVLVIELSDAVRDGPGPDLIVFENPFVGFTELGIVGVSEDGVDFVEWPCSDDGAGCAGLTPVLSHPDNGIDPTDPSVSGGDAFDLSDIGMNDIVFVRVRDTGTNEYLGNSGGFDLDAVAGVTR